MTSMMHSGDGHRSGFVTLVGRPNVGKSTLLNRILGQKVTIVSDKPQTTRTEVRGVLTRPGVQAVFCDTPGIHKPHTLLGERLNHTARSALADMDVVLFLVEADGPIGRGDAFIAGGLPKDRTVLVVNKVDRVGRDRIAEQLIVASGFEFDQYFPISARDGEAWTISGTTSWAVFPRGRSTTHRTWSPMYPRRSGWLNWSVSSCWPS